MNFLSFFAALYFSLSLLIYWSMPTKYRSRVLVIISITGVGLASLNTLIILLSIALVVFLIFRFNRVGWLVSFFVVLISLVIFKYTPFIINNLNRVGFHFKVPTIIFPIGISFFTFKLLAILFDWHNGKLSRDDITFTDYMLSLFFLPAFTSGPINRYPLLRIDSNHIEDSIERIVWGFFKKLLIAGTLLNFYTPLLGEGTPFKYLIAAYAYSFYIYFDFSGYTDIAIGLGQLFGYKLPENFAHPYLQKNISEFWKKWHMSLTQWFRDYVFIPIGGSRVSFYRIIVNTIILMLLTGIWHGAGWNFILWGLYHAFGLITWRIWRKIAIRYAKLTAIRAHKLFSYGAIFLTFNFVTMGWILFATPVWQGLHIIKTIFVGWWL